jgi:hypothetical protein
VSGLKKTGGKKPRKGKAATFPKVCTPLSDLIYYFSNKRRGPTERETTELLSAHGLGMRKPACPQTSHPVLPNCGLYLRPKLRVGHIGFGEADLVVGVICNNVAVILGQVDTNRNSNLAFLENLCTIHDEALLLSYEFSLDSLALRCRGILGQKRDLRESASFVCKLSSSALMVSGVRCPFWS